MSLMLDEPSLGLSPRMVEVIFEAVRELQEKLKFSILLVEQRALEALELCNRGYILESGRISVSGDREELMGNSVVQRAYLGAVLPPFPGVAVLILSSTCSQSFHTRSFKELCVNDITISEKISEAYQRHLLRQASPLDSGGRAELCILD